MIAELPKDIWEVILCIAGPPFFKERDRRSRVAATRIQRQWRWFSCNVLNFEWEQNLPVRVRIKYMPDYVHLGSLGCFTTNDDMIWYVQCGNDRIGFKIFLPDKHVRLHRRCGFPWFPFIIRS